MKKGEPRSVVDRVINLDEARKESIRRKCHPAFFEVAPLWKESIRAFKALGPSPAAAEVAAIERRFEERIEAILKKYSGSVQPEPGRFAAETIFRKLAKETDGEAIADVIHFERHKLPLGPDWDRNQDRDWDSTRRLLRTIDDVEHLRCGKPIMPFKGNLEHWNMFEILWGLGLEKLNPEELADLFDVFCPCTVERHDPDNLKKLRARFKRAIEAERNRTQNPAVG